MDKGTSSTIAVAAEQHIIERPRLTKILDESNARIILLVAPAGYGKTTLARQWLRDKPHVWYQATPASADPAALAIGIERALPGLSTKVLDSLRDNLSIGDDPLALAQELATASKDLATWVVVDDYNLLAASNGAEQVMAEFIAATDLRLVVTTRVRPGWLSARQLVYGEAVEFGSDILAMTDAEATAVVGSTRPDLVSASAGWPAVLGLAAAAGIHLAPSRSQPQLLYEFFADELLRAVSPELEETLVRLAVGPAAVDTGRVPNAVLQEAAERGFLVAQPETRSYSMHPLLRDFLRRRAADQNRAIPLARQIAADLIGQARWYEAFEVVEHFELKDMLECILAEGLPRTLEDGRLETARRWAEAGRRLGCDQDSTDAIESDLLARRGHHAAGHTLAVLTSQRMAGDHPLRCHTLLIAARSAHLAEDMETAGHYYARARGTAQSIAEMREATWGSLTVQMEFERDDIDDLLSDLWSLAAGDPSALLRYRTIELMRAHLGCGLRRAVDACLDARLAVPLVRDGRSSSAFYNILSISLALLGRYEAALADVEAASEIARAARLDFTRPHLGIRAAHAEIGLRHYGRATRLLNRALSDASRLDDYSALWSGRCLKARLLISQGLFDAALRILESSTSARLPRRANAELLATRALACACSGETTDARRVAAEASQMTRGVEARLLAHAAEAVCNLRSGAQSPASTFLAAFVRTEVADPFIAAIRGCEELRSELSKVASQDTPDSQPAATLLAMCRFENNRTFAPSGRSNLTPRESEVLDLLQQGLSNKEIAATLVISQVTVKVHLRHVYEKLGVRSRTQAALLAQDLEEH